MFSGLLTRFVSIKTFLLLEDDYFWLLSILIISLFYSRAAVFGSRFFLLLALTLIASAFTFLVWQPILIPLVCFRWSGLSSGFFCLLLSSFSQGLLLLLLLLCTLNASSLLLFGLLLHTRVSDRLRRFLILLFFLGCLVWLMRLLHLLAGRCQFNLRWVPCLDELIIVAAVLSHSVIVVARHFIIRFDCLNVLVSGWSFWLGWFELIVICCLTLLTFAPITSCLLHHHRWLLSGVMLLHGLALWFSWVGLVACLLLILRWSGLVDCRFLFFFF